LLACAIAIEIADCDLVAMSFVPNLLAIRFAPDSLVDTGPATPDERRWRLDPSHETAIDGLVADGSIQRIDPVFTDQPVPNATSRTIAHDLHHNPSPEVAGITLLSCRDAATTDRVLVDLGGLKGVRTIERVPARTFSPMVSSQLAEKSAKHEDWALEAIKFHPVRGLAGDVPTVAVIDTGVDAGHEELQIPSHAYHHPHGAHKDVLGHGTAVCGVISARGSRVRGVGAAPLEVWKVYDDPTPTTKSFDADTRLYWRALHQARKQHIRVVNLSLGSTDASTIEAELIERLVHGAVVVAAVGDDAGPTPYFPAAYPGVVAVGAVNTALQHWKPSNSGPALCAPGVKISSTLPRYESPPWRIAVDYSDYNQGTSLAAPFVAATVARMHARFPDRGRHSIIERLLATARPIGAGPDPTVGAGLLDFAAALEL
jgi:hypothetical protein